MRSNIQFADTFKGAGRPGWGARAMRHPFFAWAGLRPPLAQHTAAEHEALERHVRGKRSVLEIGVAEGASGVALREAMDPEGTLYLVDPFHLSRIPALNFLRRAAQRAVDGGAGAQTVWIERFSHDVARDWKLPIDFLLVDGDHQLQAVEQDWNDWEGQVVEGGIVAFHDARVFPNGWTGPDYGPVRFIDGHFRQGTVPSWTIVDEVDSLVFLRRAAA